MKRQDLKVPECGVLMEKTCRDSKLFEKIGCLDSSWFLELIGKTSFVISQTIGLKF